VQVVEKVGKKESTWKRENEERRRTGKRLKIKEIKIGYDKVNE